MKVHTQDTAIQKIQHPPKKDNNCKRPMIYYKGPNYAHKCKNP